MNHIEDGIVAAADAQSLGGKAPAYYLQPRNLLDNSDFRNPVNQREKGSYSGSVYSIDRWKLWTTATTLTINDGYITNTEREIVQLLESVDTTKTYTLAGCTYDGAIHILQGKFDGKNYADDYLRFVGDSSVYCVGLKPNSWSWAALYEGSYTADTMPPYVPKGYAAELAECQRYFQTRDTSNYQVFILGDELYFAIEHPNMRIAPSITIINPIANENNSIANLASGGKFATEIRTITKDRSIIYVATGTSGKSYGVSYTASADL